MTNEWGAPLTGEEMKALKGRIDPETPVMFGGDWCTDETYASWGYNDNDYHLPANHPYYKVREHNAKHGTNLVLHDGSANEPKDWCRGAILDKNLQFFSGGPYTKYNWINIIAYTPKPKESEMIKDVPQVATIIGNPQPKEQFPKDEAIEYVLRKCEYEVISVEHVKEDPIDYRGELLAARLIQQYEPDRLKPAVDVAAEAYAAKYDKDVFKYWACNEGFKAGVAWQKEKGL